MLNAQRLNAPNRKIAIAVSVKATANLAIWIGLPVLRGKHVSPKRVPLVGSAMPCLGAGNIHIQRATICWNLAAGKIHPAGGATEGRPSFVNWVEVQIIAGVHCKSERVLPEIVVAPDSFGFLLGAAESGKKQAGQYRNDSDDYQ